MASTASDLDRFVTAQASVHAQALVEIRAGRKRNHWMWFVFPQMRGLGRSDTAWHYGIESLEEARAYLDHPLLGARLRECVAALDSLPATTAEAVFGPVDALKLLSSLTLFAMADGADEGDGLFDRAILRWFGGRRDPATLELLRR